MSRARQRGVAAVAAVLAVAGVATSACSQDGGGGADLPASSMQRVGLNEWDVLLEGRPLLPGPVELLVTNTGAAPHDLVLDVAGERVATPVLGSGEQAVLRFDAPAGQRLVAWCSVAGHRVQGMETALVVAEN